MRRPIRYTDAVGLGGKARALNAKEIRQKARSLSWTRDQALFDDVHRVDPVIDQGADGVLGFTEIPRYHGTLEVVEILHRQHSFAASRQ